MAWAPALAACLLLSACAGTVERLSNNGQPPALSKVDNPIHYRGYAPISWPLPDAQPIPPPQANSLWQPGARTFFKDQRAAQVGDLVRVNIRIDERAKLENETERQRDTRESLGVPNLFGLENRLFAWLPGTADNENLLGIRGSSSSNSTGNAERKERIETQVAAVVTQVLPNGNFVVQGRQEVRVNFEVREIFVAGVIRPEDISTNNTIDWSQIAEARISYGGRGQLTDMQQPRYGSQVVDALAPF